MIQVILRLNVPGRRWEEALSLLRPMLNPTRAQPGCLHFDVLQDVEVSGVLCVLQEWDTQEHLYRHLRSEAYRNILAAMDVAADAPEIEFRSLEILGGMDTIGLARQG